MKDIKVATFWLIWVPYVIVPLLAVVIGAALFLAKTSALGDIETFAGAVLVIVGVVALIRIMAKE